jgi:diguanylate cyclase (GGDEF)-like protein/PAS domain S-box-containing protein
LEERGKSPLVMPCVINLEPSRLKECLLTKQKAIKYSAQSCVLDDIERDFLCPTHLNSNCISILYWPLTLNGELKGVLVLGLTGRIRLTVLRSEFLLQICTHLAIAINNSDTHYRERRRSRQLAMLGDITKEAASEGDFNRLLHKVCESVRTSLDYSSVQIWMRTGNRMHMAGDASKSEKNSVCELQAPLIVQECWDQDLVLCRNHPYSGFTKERDFKGKSQIAAPIHLQRECIGVLFVESGQLDAFASDDIDTISSVASLIASRSYNIRLFMDYQRSGEYLKAVLESAGDWAILYTDNRGYVLMCSVGVEKIFGLSRKEAIGKDILSLFTGTRIQQELMTFMEDETGISRLQCFSASQSSSKGTAYLDVSFQRVKDSEDHHIGFVGAIRDVTEKVRLEKRLRNLSTKDDLTSLYNQRGFLRAIKKEMTLSRKLGLSLSLCFLDLDNLKKCNDTYGHLCGSRVIRETAKLLLQSVRPTDICCRYGGDEFVIIMPKTNKVQAQAAIERISESLNKHFRHKITASFGIADFSDDVVTIAELLARADRALYRAKSLGKNRIVLSDK